VFRHDETEFGALAPGSRDVQENDDRATAVWADPVRRFF